jgi:hypothetical protein
VGFTTGDFQTCDQQCTHYRKFWDRAKNTNWNFEYSAVKAIKAITTGFGERILIGYFEKYEDVRLALKELFRIDGVDSIGRSPFTQEKPRSIKEE